MHKDNKRNWIKGIAMPAISIAICFGSLPLKAWELKNGWVDGLRFVCEDCGLFHFDDRLGLGQTVSCPGDAVKCGNGKGARIKIVKEGILCDDIHIGWRVPAQGRMNILKSGEAPGYMVTDENGSLVGFGPFGQTSGQKLICN